MPARASVATDGRTAMALMRALGLPAAAGARLCSEACAIVASETGSAARASDPSRANRRAEPSPPCVIDAGNEGAPSGGRGAIGLCDAADGSAALAPRRPAPPAARSATIAPATERRSGAFGGIVGERRTAADPPRPSGVRDRCVTPRVARATGASRAAWGVDGRAVERCPVVTPRWAGEALRATGMMPARTGMPRTAPVCIEAAAWSVPPTSLSAGREPNREAIGPLEPGASERCAPTPAPARTARAKAAGDRRARATSEPPSGLRSAGAPPVSRRIGVTRRSRASLPCAGATTCRATGEATSAVGVLDGWAGAEGVVVGPAPGACEEAPPVTMCRPPTGETGSAAVVARDATSPGGTSSPPGTDRSAQGSERRAPSGAFTAGSGELPASASGAPCGPGASTRRSTRSPVVDVVEP